MGWKPLAWKRGAGIIPPLFLLGTKNSHTEEEIAAYRQAHLHTHVVILYRRDCGNLSNPWHSYKISEWPDSLTYRQKVKKVVKNSTSMLKS